MILVFFVIDYNDYCCKQVVSINKKIRTAQMTAPSATICYSRIADCYCFPNFVCKLLFED